jgi:hypothetical protein
MSKRAGWLDYVLNGAFPAYSGAAEQMERADTPSLVLAPLAGVRTPRTISISSTVEQC